MVQSVISCLIGLWLMLSPAVLPVNQSAAGNNHIIGPWVMTFSIISLWNINRNILKANAVLGAWLLLALLVFDYSRLFILLSNGVCGVSLLLLSLSVKRKGENYGGGWRSLFQHNPPHICEAERNSCGAKT